MNYSRRQLYALGEPLGDAVTRKVGGKVIYGGGGGISGLEGVNLSPGWDASGDWGYVPYVPPVAPSATEPLPPPVQEPSPPPLPEPAPAPVATPAPEPIPVPLFTQAEIDRNLASLRESLERGPAEPVVFDIPIGQYALFEDRDSYKELNPQQLKIYNQLEEQQRLLKDHEDQLYNWSKAWTSPFRQRTEMAKSLDAIGITDIYKVQQVAPGQYINTETGQPLSNSSSNPFNNNPSILSAQGLADRRTAGFGVTFTPEGVPIYFSSSFQAPERDFFDTLTALLPLAVAFIPGIGQAFAPIASSILGAGASQAAVAALSQGIASGIANTIATGDLEKGILSGITSGILNYGGGIAKGLDDVAYVPPTSASQLAAIGTGALPGMSDLAWMDAVSPSQVAAAGIAALPEAGLSVADVQLSEPAQQILASATQSTEDLINLSNQIGQDLGLSAPPPPVELAQAATPALSSSDLSNLISGDGGFAPDYGGGDYYGVPTEELIQEATTPIAPPDFTPQITPETIAIAEETIPPEVLEDTLVELTPAPEAVTEALTDVQDAITEIADTPEIVEELAPLVEEPTSIEAVTPEVAPETLPEIPAEEMFPPEIQELIEESIAPVTAEPVLPEIPAEAIAPDIAPELPPIVEPTPEEVIPEPTGIEAIAPEPIPEIPVEEVFTPEIQDIIEESIAPELPIEVIEPVVPEAVAEPVAPDVVPEIPLEEALPPDIQEIIEQSMAPEVPVEAIEPVAPEAIAPEVVPEPEFVPEVSAEEVFPPEIQDIIEESLAPVSPPETILEAIQPEVIPEVVEPEIVPEIVEPEVIPEVIEPEIIPEIVAPQEPVDITDVVPEDVSPEVVSPTDDVVQQILDSTDMTDDELMEVINQIEAENLGVAAGDLTDITDIIPADVVPEAVPEVIEAAPVTEVPDITDVIPVDEIPDITDVVPANETGAPMTPEQVSDAFKEGAISDPYIAAELATGTPMTPEQVAEAFKSGPISDPYIASDMATGGPMTPAEVADALKSGAIGDPYIANEMAGATAMGTSTTPVFDAFKSLISNPAGRFIAGQVLSGAAGGLGGAGGLLNLLGSPGATTPGGISGLAQQQAPQIYYADIPEFDVTKEFSPTLYAMREGRV